MKKNIFYNYKLIKKNLNIKGLPQSQDINPKIIVDINKLLNRVKVDQHNEQKKNLIFFSLGILLLALMGTFILITR